MGRQAVNEAEWVWVFNGARGNFPAGIFGSPDLAERWIAHHRLTGTPTEYPVDIGVYDWVISQGFFRPSKPHQTTSDFSGV